MGRALLRIVAIAIVAVVAGGAGVALAAPTVTIERPVNGSTTNSPTPSFGGLAEEAAGEVRLSIHSGSNITGPLVQTVTTLTPPLGGAWELAAEHLNDGTYTAQAAQTNLASETGVSKAVTVTVDTASPTVKLNRPPSPSKDTTPSFTGTASESTTPVLIHIFNSSETEVASATAPGTGGAWSSTEASPPLSSGEYQAEATQASSIGNPPGKSERVSFTVDTTAPAVTLTPPAVPLSNNTEPSFSGSAGDAPGDNASVTLNIYSGEAVSGSPIRTVKVIPVGTTWSAVAVESLTEGTYTVQAEQSDVAGNVGLSAPSTFRIKTKGPAVSLSSVASPTKDPTPSFSGGAGVDPADIPSVTLKVYSGSAASGTPVRTMEVTPNGAGWKAELPEALSDGTYTAQAEQSDKAGNTTKSPSSTFTVDTTPPAVSLTPLAPLTNNPAPSFSGNAGVAPGDITLVTLKIYSGESPSGSPIRTIEVTPNGATWGTGLAPPLNEGTYTAQAEQSDEAGNTTRSAPSTFTVDTTPPAATLTPIAALTNNPEPSFSGSAGVAPGDLPSVTLKVYAGESISGTPVRTITVTPSGAAWKTTLLEALKDGIYTAQAEQSDNAGNTTKTAHSTFTVDTTPPAVSLNSVASPTNITPVFSGSAGVAANDNAALTLKIYAGSSASGSPVQTIAVTPTGGTWKASATAPLSEGTYTAQVEQSDKAGNVGRSAPSTFSIFLTLPPLSLNPVASPTNTKEPSFGGSAGDSSVDIPSVTLKIYSGSSVSGSPIRTLPPITPTGATWKTTLVVAEALNDGTYTAQAEQSDKAGNTTKSTPSTFTVDTTPPAVSLTSVAALTNNPKPSFSGSAGVAPGDVAAVTLKIYSGNTTAGSLIRTIPVSPEGAAWTESLAEALGEGTYTVQAEQSDEAGNTGKSATSTFTVDTTPPAVTLNSIASFTNDPTPSFNGSAGAASGDIASVTLNVYSGEGVSGVPIRTVKVVPAGTSWSASVTEALGEGAYTAQAEQTDQAGNIGRSAAATFTVKPRGPAVTLSPVNEWTNNPQPGFSGNAGTAAGDLPSVTLKIYVGESVSGSPVQTVAVKPTVGVGTWQATLSGSLPDGRYTAQAEQSDEAGNATKSARSSFTVDTTPPAVSVKASVETDRPTFIGAAGKAKGDLPTVTLKIFEGNPPSGNPVQTVVLTPKGSSWSTESSKLPNGSYTVQAEQSDEAGNTGVSTATFKILTNSPVVTLDMAEFAQRGTTLFTAGTPSFSGTASEAPNYSETVTLSVYNGTSASGAPLHIVGGTLTGATWTAGPLAALPEGTYTVQAEQNDPDFNDPGVSTPVTFSVDDAPPAVTLSYPTNGSSASGESQLLEGLAGTADGDLPSVTVQLFSGSSVEGQLLQSVVVNTSGGAWSATLAGLVPGTYTARAQQSDDTGNVGFSAPTTFTITGPGGAGAAGQATAPPAPSFTWFPSVPKPRETVSLASSSTDAISPIMAFAWDLTGSGTFVPGGQLMSTSFATAGNHVVRLRVTAADGLSSLATETIPVVAPLISLMQPFPVVRIASTDTASGIRLRVLRVLAPAGARIGVECKGNGCPARSASRIAAAGKVGVAPVEFKRFERPLRAGVVLEIRISKAGEIGKFTSFQVRRRRLPLRVDACLGPSGVKPIACPP
jgi:hypothetical protein